MFKAVANVWKPNVTIGSVGRRSIALVTRVGALSVLSLSLLLGAVSISAAKDQNSSSVSFTPGITLTLEVSNSQGAPRVYATAGGPTYWATGLPVAKGDHVKVDIFVSTGGGELKQVKVRLDNQLVATLDKTPWSTTIDTNTLGLGYHNLEVWASEEDSKHPAFATKTMTFYVDSEVPPANEAPVVAVKGEQQVLNGSSVTDVPLSGNPKIPAVPSALSGTTEDSTATVTLSAADAAAQQALAAGSPVALSSPIVVSVNTPVGSTAHKFIYSLVRGDQTIYQADHAVGTGLAKIRLQQRTDAQPGLLPGRVVLWVWGVDDQGNYGNPVSATFDIAAPAAAS